MYLYIYKCNVGFGALLVLMSKSQAIYLPEPKRVMFAFLPHFVTIPQLRFPSVSWGCVDWRQREVEKSFEWSHSVSQLKHKSCPHHLTTLRRHSRVAYRAAGMWPQQVPKVCILDLRYEKAKGETCMHSSGRKKWEMAMRYVAHIPMKSVFQIRLAGQCRHCPKLGVEGNSHTKPNQCGVQWIPRVTLGKSPSVQTAGRGWTGQCINYSPAESQLLSLHCVISQFVLSWLTLSR